MNHAVPAGGEQVGGRRNEADRGHPVHGKAGGVQLPVAGPFPKLPVRTAHDDRGTVRRDVTRRDRSGDRGLADTGTTRHIDQQQRSTRGANCDETPIGRDREVADFTGTIIQHDRSMHVRRNVPP